MSITNAPEMEILDKQQATARCRARVRVRHEDLPGVDGLDTSTTVPRSSPGQGLFLPLSVVTASRRSATTFERAKRDRAVSQS